MIKEHTKSELRPARTIYKLTKDEVVDALVLFVGTIDDAVPDGEWDLWVRDPRDSTDEPPFALVVDHSAEPEPDA